MTKALGTDGRTDGQSLLMRCEDASKNDNNRNNKNNKRSLRIKSMNRK